MEKHAPLTILYATDGSVLGSRGLGRVEAALLGSVSQQVVQQALCQVLIVR